MSRNYWSLVLSARQGQPREELPEALRSLDGAVKDLRQHVPPPACTGHSAAAMSSGFPQPHSPGSSPRGHFRTQGPDLFSSLKEQWSQIPSSLSQLSVQCPSCHRQCTWHHPERSPGSRLWAALTDDQLEAVPIWWGQCPPHTSLALSCLHTRSCHHSPGCQH